MYSAFPIKIAVHPEVGSYDAGRYSLRERLQIFACPKTNSCSTMNHRGLAAADSTGRAADISCRTSAAFHVFRVALWQSSGTLKSRSPRRTAQQLTPNQWDLLPLAGRDALTWKLWTTLREENEHAAADSSGRISPQGLHQTAWTVAKRAGPGQGLSAALRLNENVAGKVRHHGCHEHCGWLGLLWHYGRNTGRVCRRTHHHMAGALQPAKAH